MLFQFIQGCLQPIKIHLHFNFWLITSILLGQRNEAKWEKTEFRAWTSNKVYLMDFPVWTITLSLQHGRCLNSLGYVVWNATIKNVLLMHLFRSITVKLWDHAPKPLSWGKLLGNPDDFSRPFPSLKTCSQGLLTAMTALAIILTSDPLAPQRSHQGISVHRKIQEVTYLFLLEKGKHLSNKY